MNIHGLQVSSSSLRDILRLERPPGGGGGHFHIAQVSGTCRWTGYDFAIILALKTG